MSIVPFPDGVGRVAGFAQALREGGESFPVSRIFDPVPMAPGHKHAATGDADGSAIAACAVVAREAEAVGGQPVQVGGLYVLVAVGADGVGPLIIGKEEDDVGTTMGFENGESEYEYCDREMYRSFH